MGEDLPVDLPKLMKYIQGIYAWLMGGVDLPRFWCNGIQGIYAWLMGGVDLLVELLNLV